MTDLTNRSAQEANELVQKYTLLLEYSGVRTVIDAQLFAIMLDVAIKYLQENHKDLNSDWKAWSVIVLKKQFKKIRTEEDIKKTIDNFIEYYQNEYQNFIDDLGMFASEYDRDLGFVSRFLHKKNR
jgi:hypothetical protein